MPSLSLRINLDPAGRIGPGKVELLERIAAEGSISGGARRHGHVLQARLGPRGGDERHLRQAGGHGAEGRPEGRRHPPDPLGEAVVRRFRAIEESAASAAAQHVAALQAEIEAA